MLRARTLLNREYGGLGPPLSLVLHAISLFLFIDSVRSSPGYLIVPWMSFDEFCRFHVWGYLSLWDALGTAGCP